MLDMSAAGEMHLCWNDDEYDKQEWSGLDSHIWMSFKKGDRSWLKDELQFNGLNLESYL